MFTVYCLHVCTVYSVLPCKPAIASTTRDACSHTGVLPTGSTGTSTRSTSTGVPEKIFTVPGTRVYCFSRPQIFLTYTDMLGSREVRQNRIFSPVVASTEVRGVRRDLPERMTDYSSTFLLRQ